MGRRSPLLRPCPTGQASAAGVDAITGLNAEQRRAVEHTGGPLLILAGAGTGKTRTLVARVAHLLASGVPPERILLVTFSRRAADELLGRVALLVDPAVAGRLHAGTFHSVAWSVLRRYGEVLGLGAQWSGIDSADAADLFGLVRTDHVGRTPARFPEKHTLLAIYSRVVNSGTPLSETLRRQFPWCAADGDDIAAIFRDYVARKRSAGLLDYDDLLLYWRAAAADPVVGPDLREAYDHILVDEYQDTNVLQSEVLRSLREGNDSITVVGDDAQAIYGFRAATVRNILDFPEHFPGATVITLEENYRSTTPILAVANAVLAEAADAFPKRLRSGRAGGSKPWLVTCYDERCQAEAVCDAVLEHRGRGMALREQVVLFRAAHHSSLLEVELSRRKIPFVKYGGLRFLEAAHVRDLVCLLRILENPWDELAWHRSLQLLDGVGPATATSIMGDLGVRPPRRSAPDPLARFVAMTGAAGAADDAASLGEALGHCTGAALGPAVQVERLRVVLAPLLESRYGHGPARDADLEQIGRLAARHPDRSRLIAELTVDPPRSSAELAGAPTLDDDYLTLSTVHSAKGGEWRSVQIIHAADGMFPSDLATGDSAGIEEERRLFYVALTRAREHLAVYIPLRYHHSRAFKSGDRHSYAQRTRFLPRRFDGLFATSAVSPPRPPVEPAVTGRARPVSVDGALEALWG